MLQQHSKQTIILRSKSTEKRQSQFTKRKYLSSEIKQSNKDLELMNQLDFFSDSDSENSNYSNSKVKVQTSFQDQLIGFKYLLSLPKIKQPKNQIEEGQIYKQGTQTAPGSEISFDQEKTPKFQEIGFEIKNQYIEKLGNNFSEDSLQFLALYYQLSKHDFQRTPITQCSPILAYYLFSILISYEQTDHRSILIQIALCDSDMQNLFQEIIFSPQQKLSLQLLFLSQFKPYSGLILESIEYIQKQLIFLKEIEQKLGRTLNYQLAIDDFLMYQELFVEKKLAIIEQIQENKYGNNNICIAYLRFVFYEDKGQFEIRLPVGEFDQQNLINQESLKINQQFMFQYELYQFIDLETAVHSEILLFLWIVINQQVIADQLTIQLEKMYESIPNYQKVVQLTLKEVYFEITSETRVCQQCVDKFPLFPTPIISEQIVNKIKSTLFTIQIATDFRLIIVSQYLLILNAKAFKKEQQPLYCKGIHGLPKNKDIFYFETDCVGIMTKEYLVKRYTMQHNNNSLYTQRIDFIKPTNTFFFSEYLSDYSSNESDVQEQPQVQQLDSLDIYALLTYKISQIKWVNQLETKIIQKEGNISQQQTLLCYQLVKMMIEKQIRHEEIHYLISPKYLQNILRQVCFKEVPEHSRKLRYFLDDLKQFEEIDNKQYEREFDNFKDNILKSQNIFNSGFLNMKLVLCDYQFMIVNSISDINNQPPTMLENNFEKPNLIKNFGLFKINLIFQDSCQQTNQEILEIQINKIDIDFTNKFTQLFLNRQQQLKDEGIIINKIVCFIITLQQLSLQYKYWIESQINLGIQIDYYYSYFRKLQPLSQQVYKNEEQYLVFDVKNLENRYSIENADYQMPLVNMETNPIVQLKYFDEESIKQSQLIQYQGK